MENTAENIKLHKEIEELKQIKHDTEQELQALKDKITVEKLLPTVYEFAHKIRKAGNASLEIGVDFLAQAIVKDLKGEK